MEVSPNPSCESQIKLEAEIQRGVEEGRRGGVGHRRRCRCWPSALLGGGVERPHPFSSSSRVLSSQPRASRWNAATLLQDALLQRKPAANVASPTASTPLHVEAGDWGGTAGPKTKADAAPPALRTATPATGGDHRLPPDAVASCLAWRRGGGTGWGTGEEVRIGGGETGPV